MEKTFDELVDLKVITQVGTPTDLTKDELIEQGYITDVTIASDLEITDEVDSSEPEDEPVVEFYYRFIFSEDEPVVEPEDEPVVEPEDEPIVDEGEEE